MRTSRAWFAILALTAGGFIAGCGSTTKPMTIALRDAATHQPVAQALVVVRPVHLYFPSWPYGILNPSPAKPTSGVTGADGTVRLETVVRQAAQVVAVAPGHTAMSTYLKAHPAQSGPTDWIALDQDDETEPPNSGLEIRFVPDQAGP